MTTTMTITPCEIKFNFNGQDIDVERERGINLSDFETRFNSEYATLRNDFPKGELVDVEIQDYPYINAYLIGKHFVLTAYTQGWTDGLINTEDVVELGVADEPLSYIVKADVNYGEIEFCVYERHPNYCNNQEGYPTVEEAYAAAVAKVEAAEMSTLELANSI